MNAVEQVGDFDCCAKATRGTSNGNSNGNSEDRRRRRVWLVETYRANTDVLLVTTQGGRRFTATDSVGNRSSAELNGASVEVVAACRCYRCGELLSADTVTVDRIIPGCFGGTYRRNNIRPACGPCNSETGGALAHLPKKQSRR